MSHKTITLQLPQEAAKKLRVLAAEEDRHIGDFIRDALELWWEAKGYASQRGPLGVSSAVEKLRDPQEPKESKE